MDLYVPAIPRVLLVFYFLIVQIRITTAWNNVTFCSVSNPLIDDRTPRYHQSVQSDSSSHIKFIYAKDRYTCLELLLNNSVDFGVFRPEDLFATPKVGNKYPDDLKITHEFRPQWCRKYEFDMIVLVSNEVSEIDTLYNFRGKSICFPGAGEYGWLFDFSSLFLQIFASPGTPEDECDKNITSYENKLRILTNFFGRSCLPGPWTPSPTVDLILKKKYPNLCSLCSRSCSTNDRYWSQKGTFSCIGDSIGEVTWLKWHDVISFYRSSPENSDVSLFCLGQYRAGHHSQLEDCKWLSKPRPIIVSHKSASSDVDTLITHINQSENTQKPEEWEYKFRKILLKSNDDLIFSTGSSSFEYYLNTTPYFSFAYSLETCKFLNKSLKICFENKDDVKICDSMRLVSRVYSIDSHIECIQENDCERALEKNEIDAFVSPANNLNEIFENSKMDVALYQKSDVNSGNLFELSAVVKNDAELSTLTDLKNKRACFPKRNGFAWNAFLITLRNNSMVDQYPCFGDHVFRNFFSNVFVADPKETKFKTLSYRSSNIYSDERQKTEADALRCLIENKADVAFINYAMIEQYLDDNRGESWTDDIITEDFKTVCPEKYKYQLNKRCILAFETPRKVIISKGLSNAEVERITFPILLSTSFLSTKTTSEDEETPDSGADFRLYKLPKYNGKEAMLINDDNSMEFQDAFMYRSQFKSLAYELEYEKMFQECAGAKPPPPPPPSSQASSYNYSNIYHIISIQCFIEICIYLKVKYEL